MHLRSMRRSTTIPVATALLLATPAVAGGLPTALFDFEDAPLQTNQPGITLFSGEQSMSIQMSSAPLLTIRANGPGHPAGWGDRSLDLTFRPGESFLMSFQPGITGVRFEYGATGPREVILEYEIFFTLDGSGTPDFFGGIVLDNRVDEGADPHTFLFSYLAPTTSLGSIRFTNIAGGTADMGIDNITLFIPAPGAAGLLAAGALLAARRRRSA